MFDDAAKPAAIPAVVFTTTLFLSKSIVNPATAIAGLAVAVVLALALRSAGGVRTGSLLAVALLALSVGLADRERLRRDIAWTAPLRGDRFVEVAIPLRSGWEARERESRLFARQFEVRHDGMSRTIRAPIFARTYAEVEPAGLHTTMIAEGFLSRSVRNRYSFRIKSARLVRYEGRSSALHPSTWNRAIAARLEQIAADEPRHAAAVGLVHAVVLGRSDRLPAETKEAYRRGGTYHLLVFSGMQITAAAAFIALMLRRARLRRTIDASLLAIALVAPAFAGNEPSVARSSLMIGIYAVSRLMRRPTSLANLLFVSAMIRLVLEPQELTDLGFALTYAATGGLFLLGRNLAMLAAPHPRILSTEPRNPLSLPRRAAAAMLHGAGAELATTPLTLLFFNQYVIGGSIVTLLLSPVFFSMLAVGALAIGGAFVSPAAAELPLRAIALLDRFATLVNGSVANSLRLSGFAPSPPPLLVAFAFVIAVLLLAPRPALRRGIAAALLLASPAMLSWHLLRQRACVERPSVEMLDVGQGDSILVRSGCSSILIDGGGRSGDPLFGRNVVVPLLAERGVTKLDAVALTHPHPDHCVGLHSVVENLDVREVWLAAAQIRESCAMDLAEIARGRMVPIRLVDRETRLFAGTIELERFHRRFRYKRAAMNNDSVVYRTVLGRHSVLLTGDIEREAERLLVEDFGEQLRADVLKVAHHGSRNSTTDPFLDVVDPRLAFISCGRNNSFGHPTPEVLERLLERAVRVYRTDRDGTIASRFGRDRIDVSKEFDMPRGAP